MSLFAPDMSGVAAAKQRAPLAERMRPRTLEEFFGQTHLLAEGKPLRLQIERDDSASLIFWGPPGVGKTTLAKIIAAVTSASFIEFSAVLSGIKEIKNVMVEAEKAAQYGSRTILFVDEIHRFNKAQQDAFLPYVERGSIRLIGATTENPSFEINAALLSRCRVYTLRALEQEEVMGLLDRALRDSERGLGSLGLEAEEGAIEAIASYSSGDARNALNALEVAAKLAEGRGEKLLTPGDCCGGAAAASVALRQERGAALRFDLGAAQERAELGCGCFAVLAGADVESRGRPDVCGAARGADGCGGHRAGGSGGAEFVFECAGCDAFSRVS